MYADRNRMLIYRRNVDFFVYLYKEYAMNMSVKVYIINDPEEIVYILNSDVEGFKDYLDKNSDLLFDGPEVFETEEEALAFCSEIGYGIDECALIEDYPLRSCEAVDIPFINAIENY